MNRRLLPAFFFLALAASTAEAGVLRWTRHGPYGTPVSSVAVHPEDPMTVYAATDEGVFRSADGGATWTPSATRLARVRVILLDPRTPSTLHAGVASGPLQRSTDGGETWSAVGAYVNAHDLEIDPREPATIYAARHVGVLRTRTGGERWVELDLGLAPSSRVFGLALDLQTPSTLYAGTADGLLKTTDEGRSWTRLLAGEVDVLSLDPQDPSTIYVKVFGDGGGVLRSTNGGAGWSPVPGFEAVDVEVLAIDPGTASTFYAGAQGGVFRSTDGGSSWASVSDGVSIGTLAIAPSDPSIVFAGSGAGVLKAAAGERFAASSEGLPAALTRMLVLDPRTTAPGTVPTLYAGTFGGGVFKSTDRGETWALASRGLVGGLVLGLAIGPQPSASGTMPTLYAGTLPGGLFKSTDGAATWELSSPDLAGVAVGPVVVDSTDSSIVYAAAGRFLYRSTDGGRSFTDLEDIRRFFPEGIDYVQTVTVDPREPSTIWVGAFHNVLKSTNRGDKWRRLKVLRPFHPHLDVRAIAVDPETSDVYVGGSRILQRSRDGGQTWELWGDGISSLSKPQVVDLAFAPGAPSPVLYASNGRGLYHRSTSADAWTYVGDYISDGGKIALEVGPPVVVHRAGWGVSTMEIPPRTHVLELHGGRFEVAVEWRDFQGQAGASTLAVVPGEARGATALASRDSAVVEFFSPGNWEMLVKVLDGRAVNGRFWVFVAAATNVAYTATVTDTSCGATRTYVNPLGVAAPARADTAAFAGCESPAPPDCAADRDTLCLGDGGRFRVEITWSDFMGHSGSARQVRLPRAGPARSDDSGLFYFFTEDNWELLVKVLDGCALNGHFWVFAAATTTVEYALQVTDTATGAVRTYGNPLGVAADAVADTAAFATCDAGQ